MNRNMARSYNRKLAGDGGSYVIDFTAGQSFGEWQGYNDRLAYFSDQQQNPGGPKQVYQTCPWSPGAQSSRSINDSRKSVLLRDALPETCVFITVKAAAAKALQDSPEG